MSLLWRLLISRVISVCSENVSLSIFALVKTVSVIDIDRTRKNSCCRSTAMIAQTFRRVRQDRVSVFCAFCWFASIVACVVTIALLLVSSLNTTARRAAFEGNASLIVGRWNSTLDLSLERLNLASSFFGAVEHVDAQSFGYFFDLLNLGNETVTWAKLVPKKDLASFVASVRAEVVPRRSVCVSRGTGVDLCVCVTNDAHACLLRSSSPITLFSAAMTRRHQPTHVCRFWYENVGRCCRHAAALPC